MSKSATALRRWLGVFCLAIASGMLIWGRTLLEPYLEGTLFLAYWFVFLVFTCGAVAISLLDFFAVRRMLLEDIATLRDRALKEIDHPPRTLHRTEQRDTPIRKP
ncbi:MAG TPA: hypothetical protein VNU68_20310 [Verrucomicrobiae bacterium]|jgi:hypothetical protein|nr:hypothetical protein [Verrucomicrobiae bacterium]